MMNASNPSSIEKLRECHGDDCWLCGGKLSFDAPPNSKKAPTREHLIAVSQGGTNAFDNLVLCHPGCNRQLGIRPVADKLKMREKRIAIRATQAAAKAQPAAKKPASKTAPAKPATSSTPVSKAVSVKPVPAKPVARATPGVPSAATSQAAASRAGTTAPNWQAIAMIATAAATFFAGLCLGMLIG